MSAPTPPASASPVSTPPRLRGVPADARRAIVVGASSGIGAALVRQLAREGYAVAALARRADQLLELAAECADDAARTGGRVITRAHDVLDTDAIPALFEELVRELGGLDLFVFAAGIMPRRGPEEYDTEADLDMLAVNLGGCIAWCNPTANYFRTQRRGTLVGISSVAGDRGRKANPVYGTTKAGMNHYLEALRNRLGESGVHVCTIKPGFIDTAMTRELESKPFMISAEAAADRILRAARGRANTRYVARIWFWVMTVIRCIPSFVFRKLNV
ncbi:MAG: SDR family NAD(P)-dependent oxidoreductase [Planctomycetes bacterium]|nr:SDR family NAD(P)-dependent oxidoreductase [Planctomycetota bacterium]